MEVEIWFLIFAALVFIVILAGVKNGVERVSKVMMPLLILLAACVAVYPSQDREPWKASNIS